MIAALAMFAVSSCGTKNFPAFGGIVQAPVIQELAITVLHKADYNIDDSQTVKDFKTLATDTDYRTELARHSVEVPKPIDFTEVTVLASTMGTQISGGFVISVVRAEEYAEKVVVTVQLNSPGASCITTQALSNPYEFVMIPTVKPIEFAESQIVSECA